MYDVVIFWCTLRTRTSFFGWHLYFGMYANILFKWMNYGFLY